MKEVIGIIQPNYIPWRGYFDFINDVDSFVFLDDVQYTPRDWRNRNRIKLLNGSCTWLSVPVVGGRNQLICDVLIDAQQNWQHKHLEAIRHNYGKTPYFDQYFPEIAKLLAETPPRLSDLDIMLTQKISRWLGLKRKFLRASSLGTDGTKDDKLIAIVKSISGTHYLSGPAARDYIQPDRWRKAGVEVAFKDYSGYPEYPQISEPFESSVSVLDLLFAKGPEAPDYIWGHFRSRCIQRPE